MKEEKIILAFFPKALKSLLVGQYRRDFLAQPLKLSSKD